MSSLVHGRLIPFGCSAASHSPKPGWPTLTRGCHADNWLSPSRSSFLIYYAIFWHTLFHTVYHRGSTRAARWWCIIVGVWIALVQVLMFPTRRGKLIWFQSSLGESADCRDLAPLTAMNDTTYLVAETVHESLCARQGCIFWLKLLGRHGNRVCLLLTSMLQWQNGWIEHC